MLRAERLRNSRFCLPASIGALAFMAGLTAWGHSSVDESGALLGAPVWESRMEWLAGGDSTQIQREGDTGRIRLTFSGILESAPTVSGPWTPVGGARSPHVAEPTERRLFYRAGNPGREGVFSSRSVVDWRVSGPLQTHFDLAFAGSPDGIFPPRREKPYFDGSVAVGGTTVGVSLRVRGNSSLQECPFPKLKVKVSRAEAEGTPFEEAREVKIGTHCADGGRGTIGRLRDERAAYRETLAYEVMEALGFLSPRVRRARIEFRDTSPVDAPNPGGWNLVRNAMLLEDPEVVAERLGGHALNDAELSELHGAQFGLQLITDLRLLHVLLGNWDYQLSEDGRGLWNTDVIRMPDGTHVPMAGDFDLCSWVTERVRSSAPRNYHPELPELDRQARYELEEIRRQVPPAVFAIARDRFLVRLNDMKLRIRDADVDEEGRVNSLRHVDAFAGAMSATE